MLISMMLLFAILDRARGSKLFDLITSTQVSRIVSTGLMATAVMGISGNIYTLLAWPLLFGWSIAGWGVYQGTATGTRSNFTEKEFAPVDWLMSKISYFDDINRATVTDLECRLWGTIAMALRQMLLAPYIVAIGGTWQVVLIPLMALPYMAAGYLVKRDHIMYAEYASGAVLGAICYLAGAA